MAEDYLAVQVTTIQALEIAIKIYHLEGEILALPGDEDFNFRIKDKEESYILKVSRPNADLAYLEYQQELLTYLKTDSQSITPAPIPDVEGNKISTITDSSGKTRLVRLLSWIDGRLWSSINPRNDKLLLSIGLQTGMLTKALQGFDHKSAHRENEWDIAQAAWTFNYQHLFSDDQQAILRSFQEAFKDIQPGLNELRKSVVHNDANDNNVIVTDDLVNPEVKAIIDFGDAIYTPIINDLAITIAYAIMHKPDALAASLPIIKGYNKAFPLQEDELLMLHTLVAMRLTISVIKSAINRTKEPDNKYLLISEKPAWEVLEKWHKINKHFATYSFRLACGLDAHPEEKVFAKWAEKTSVNLQTMVPEVAFKNVHSPDMSVGSTFLGNTSEFTDINFLAYKRNLI
ncbi:MAG: peptidase M23, partial [Bacteroidetes bacterium]